MIGFNFGAITSSPKINVLLIRLLLGLSYDGISGLNFPRLDPMKEIGFNFGAKLFSQDINVLLIRILFGVSYDEISGLNFQRLYPIKVVRW